MSTVSFTQAWELSIAMSLVVFVSGGGICHTLYFILIILCFLSLLFFVCTCVFNVATIVFVARFLVLLPWIGRLFWAGRSEDSFGVLPSSLRFLVLSLFLLVLTCSWLIATLGTCPPSLPHSANRRLVSLFHCRIGAFGTKGAAGWILGGGGPSLPHWSLKYLTKVSPSADSCTPGSIPATSEVIV